jgi:rubrerythrin
MKDSKTWWAEVKSDEFKLKDWLQRQYRGEMRAAAKLRDVVEFLQYSVAHKDVVSESQLKILTKIAYDEAMHASWIYNILRVRGITPKEDKDNAENRYWSKIDQSYSNFAKLMAAGAHAEKMRLERIEEIAMDPFAPDDIRNTFLAILKDEIFHEYAFRKMAGEAAMADTLPAHLDGKRLLGLEP